MPAPKGNKNAKGNKGGRPTKFRPEFTQELIKFFDINPYKQEVSEYTREYFKDGEIKRESKKYRLIANRLPTLYRFAEKIGVAYLTLIRWADKGEWLEEDGKAGQVEPPKEFVEFRNAYKSAKELQKEFLISLGLSGATNPAAYAFTAKNITDMKDKVETEHSGSVEVKNTITFEGQGAPDASEKKDAPSS